MGTATTDGTIPGQTEFSTAGQDHLDVLATTLGPVHIDRSLGLVAAEDGFMPEFVGGVLERLF